MTTAALVLAAVFAAVVVLYVARPFLRAEPAGEIGKPGERELERVRLVEERDRALAALKELEFDHRTGKISDDDYRRLLVPLREDAAAALSALSGGKPGSEATDREPPPL